MTPGDSHRADEEPFSGVSDSPDNPGPEGYNGSELEDEESSTSTASNCHGQRPCYQPDKHAAMCGISSGCPAASSLFFLSLVGITNDDISPFFHKVRASRRLSGWSSHCLHLVLPFGPAVHPCSCLLPCSYIH